LGVPASKQAVGLSLQFFLLQAARHCEEGFATEAISQLLSCPFQAAKKDFRSIPNPTAGSVLTKTGQYLSPFMSKKHLFFSETPFFLGNAVLGLPNPVFLPPIRMLLPSLPVLLPPNCVLLP
jgi:hypothetical protein